MDIEALKRQAIEARRSWHTVEGKEFQIQRPTELESIDLVNAAGDPGRNVLPAIEATMAFVVDWKGMTLQDVFPGCEPEPVPFDRGLLKMYIHEHVRVGDQLSGLIFESIKAHRQRVADEKKS